MADQSIGTYIFYSNRAMGSEKSRITADELRAFASRQNLISQVSAIDAGIHGSQCESYTFVCSTCNSQQDGNLLSEKGIDSTLITYLFDMIDSWAVATIISHDADFVPAIHALRKKGKVVYGAGYIKRASAAMIRECYEYFDIEKKYIHNDLALFDFLGKGGAIDGLLHSAASSGMSDQKVFLSDKALNLFTRESREILRLTIRLAFPKTTQGSDGHKEILAVSKALTSNFKNLRVEESGGGAEDFVGLYLNCNGLEFECIRRLAERRYFDYQISLPGEKV